MGLTKHANYPTLHTYHQRQTSSQIDYILVKKNEDTCVPNIIQLVKVRDYPQNTSDHIVKMYKDKEVKKNVKDIFLSMCDVKIFLTFTSPNMVLL